MERSPDRPLTSDLSYRITVKPTYQSRIAVRPPNFQPDDASSVGFEAHVKKKLEPAPLVVLIHAPHIVYTSSPKLFTDKSARLAIQNFGTVINIHIIEYKTPGEHQYIKLGLKKCYLETHRLTAMNSSNSKTFCMSCVPIFGNRLRTRSTCGAILAIVCRCPRAEYICHTIRRFLRTDSLWRLVSCQEQ